MPPLCLVCAVLLLFFAYRRRRCFLGSFLDLVVCLRSWGVCFVLFFEDGVLGVLFLEVSLKEGFFGDLQVGPLADADLEEFGGGLRFQGSIFLFSTHNIVDRFIRELWSSNNPPVVCRLAAWACRL